jgi:hypothetical protein
MKTMVSVIGPIMMSFRNAILAIAHLHLEEIGWFFAHSILFLIFAVFLITEWKFSDENNA